MKVSRSTIIDLPPETVWSEVQTARLLKHIAWPLVRFLPVGDGEFEAFEPGGRYPVELRLFGVLPFGTQWIVTSMHETETSEWPKQLRDNGYSALISKWDHWITIAPDGKGSTRYKDEIDISAGLITPMIWVFAQMFYRHRQIRWRGLARTLHVRHLIHSEMVAYQDARIIGDHAAAWARLERSHIFSQPFLGLHLANHWAMLRFAISVRDVKEATGQIFRLALAPLGAMTGRIPIGNTGRSNVSAFRTMPIPDDLAYWFKEHRK